MEKFTETRVGDLNSIFHVEFNAGLHFSQLDHN